MFCPYFFKLQINRVTYPYNIMCLDHKLVKEHSFVTALSKVQNLCSKQEKCCFDIRKKLDLWQLSLDEQDKIMQSLIDDKFIDENRYAVFYVRDKYRFNKWGRRKITYHLKKKKIPELIIANALEGISEQEYENNLEEILASKVRSIREDDPYKLKAKLYRFAESRGFESNLILKNIEKLLHKNN